MALISVPALPFWGGISDRTGRYRLVLSLAVVGFVLDVSVALAVRLLGKGPLRIFGAFGCLAVFSFFAAVCSAHRHAGATAARSLFQRYHYYSRQRIFDALVYGLTTLVIGLFIRQWDVRVMFIWRL